MKRLRFVANLNPAVPGLGKADVGREISFIPLEAVWADGRFDASRTIQFNGDIQSYNPVAEGDLLVPKVSPTFAHGRAAIAKGLVGARALATSEVFVLRARSADGTRFLQYRMLARDFLSEGQAAWYGVAGLKRISANFLLDVRIDANAWQNRVAIANFLDRERARIDDLVSEIRSLERAEVEALESLRERILIRCGSTVRLKYGLISCVDTAHATCPQVDEGPHLVIRTTGVRQGTLDIAGCYSTDDTGFAAWTRRRVPRPGGIVFTREAPVGEAAVIPSHGSWCLGQRSVLLVTDRGLLDPDFVVLALYGRAVKEEIILRSRSTTAAHLNVSEIGELPIPMPSVERQTEAASEFATARSRFGVLRTETQAVSATLVEYRDALITEAVTGELDVTKVGESQMDECLAAVREGAQPEVLA